MSRKLLGETPLRDAVLIGVLFLILTVQTFLVTVSIKTGQEVERGITILQTFSEKSIQVDQAGHEATTNNLRCLVGWLVDPDRDLGRLEECFQEAPPPPPSPKGS